jgi:hypothetical protein
MKATRRSFLITSIGAVSALALSREALADAPMLSETDPTAVALGYKSDATKVDKAKVSEIRGGPGLRGLHAVSGQEGLRVGPVRCVPGKQVSAKGWCSAFSKMG